MSPQLASAPVAAKAPAPSKATAALLTDAELLTKVRRIKELNERQVTVSAVHPRAVEEIEERVRLRNEAGAELTRRNEVFVDPITKDRWYPSADGLGHAVCIWSHWRRGGGPRDRSIADEAEEELIRAMNRRDAQRSASKPR